MDGLALATPVRLLAAAGDVETRVISLLSPTPTPALDTGGKKSFQAAELLLQPLQNSGSRLVHSPFRDAHFRGHFGNLRPRNGGLQNIRQDREWKSRRSRSTIRRLALAEVEGSSR